MKAEITIENLLRNNSLLNFFISKQGQDTLNEILDNAKSKRRIINEIENYYKDMEEFSEELHIQDLEFFKELFGQYLFD